MAIFGLTDLKTDKHEGTSLITLIAKLSICNNKATPEGKKWALKCAERCLLKWFPHILLYFQSILLQTQTLHF